MAASTCSRPRSACNSSCDCLLSLLGDGLGEVGRLTNLTDQMMGIFGPAIFQILATVRWKWQPANETSSSCLHGTHREIQHDDFYVTISIPIIQVNIPTTFIFYIRPIFSSTFNFQSPRKCPALALQRLDDTSDVSDAAAQLGHGGAMPLMALSVAMLSFLALLVAFRRSGASVWCDLFTLVFNFNVCSYLREMFFQYFSRIVFAD